ncbi:Golgin subfamily A member 7 [Mycena venus]|uniref:Ras modification protein ERF4 n=1 Tax=Mycena venus TaxID=2733690 RepID=A0A8H6XFK7_9AGAR|nr:Golgin subfamily A member 7 [Mycena venus]
MSTAPPSPQDSSHSPAPVPVPAPSIPSPESQTNVVDASNANTALTHPLDAPPSPHEADITEAREGGVAGDDRGGVALPSPKGGLGKDEGERERERAPQRESSIWPNDLPPSPPLTPSNNGHSVRERVGAAGDPLRFKGESEEVEGGQEHEEHAHVLETDTVDFHAQDELEPEPIKPKATVVRQASKIQLDAKMEPQPWDLVDPPETNGQTNAEYYASLRGRKFNTLNSSRARALIPKSSYYFGPPPSDSAYGTQPIGQIGVHHPREILRVERDYTGGELIQFAPIYPLELEGRITPTQFLESINAINELLISAHSLRHSFLDNMLSVFTLQLSRVILTSHYEKEMRQLQLLIQELNEQVYNPVGLNILWPRKVAFLFMEIEYY